MSYIVLIPFVLMLSDEMTCCLFTVQNNDCPGSGGGLCRCSAGGSCPTVPAGQRNSQAAFLNSKPTTTAALSNQTVKGDKTKEEEEENESCPDTHKAAETVMAHSTANSNV